MEYVEKKERLTAMIFLSIFRLAAFAVVWFAFCALADYVLMLDADSWRMSWGFVAGMCAGLFSDFAAAFIKGFRNG